MLLTYQWEIFIGIEILSLVCLLLFGFFRYFLGKKKHSTLFIVSFIALLFLEAILAFIIYQETGEFSTFQMVIMIFLLYACTFGINDFRNLDRWMRKKIGKWRKVELLTDKDYEIMRRNKDPKYIARKYRITSTIHLVIFLVVQFIFWSLGTENVNEMIMYIKDLSWIEAGKAEVSPYPNETLYAIGMIWMIVFAVDFLWSWSYTIFPSKGND